MLVPLFLWLGFCGVAHALDQVLVTTKIDGIEIFERIVLGRGLRADWATAKLDLLSTDDLDIHIIAGPYASESGDLASEAENIAQKILTTSLMATGRKMSGEITIERADDLDAACRSFLKSEANANGRNVILVAVGDDAQRCTAAAEKTPFSLSRAKTDMDLGNENSLNCASRLRSATKDDGKLMVVAATSKGNKGDAYLLRYCLFDRSFSFFGMRGRLVYDSIAREDMIDSLRTVPHPALIPGLADMLTMAVAYEYLADGSDYATVRDGIKKKLTGLQQ